MSKETPIYLPPAPKGTQPTYGSGGGSLFGLLPVIIFLYLLMSCSEVEATGGKEEYYGKEQMMQQQIAAAPIPVEEVDEHVHRWYHWIYHSDLDSGVVEIFAMDVELWIKLFTAVGALMVPLAAILTFIMWYKKRKEKPDIPVKAVAAKPKPAKKAEKSGHTVAEILVGKGKDRKNVKVRVDPKTKAVSVTPKNLNEPPQ